MPFCIACFSLTAVSPAQAGRQAPGDLQRALLQIEQQIADANDTCNYAFFRSIEAPEFIFTDSRGTVTTRAEDLAGEKDCKPRTLEHHFDELRVIGNGDTAILNARHTIAGQRDGKPFQVQTRFTDVFARRNGKWQLIAGHTSRIPADQK